MSGQQEDYALVRFKEIPAGFPASDSPSIIVNAIRDIIEDDTAPFEHHWELSGSNGINRYKSIEPISGSFYQHFWNYEDVGRVKFVYFSAEESFANGLTTLQDLNELGIEPLFRSFDLGGTTKTFDQEALELIDEGHYELDGSKIHRVWVAEYQQIDASPCSSDGAAAITILVEEVTDESTAEFKHGAHFGGIITPIDAGARIKTLSIDGESALAFMKTDAALVGRPAVPDRLVPYEQPTDPDYRSWMGQFDNHDGSFVQLSNGSRNMLTSIAHGSHLPDSAMLNVNNRSKLLSPSIYALQSPDGIPWKQFSAGSYHSLAIDSVGRAWAWGDNFYGQLGTGNAGGAEATYELLYDSDVPVLVTVPSGHPGTWLQISAGSVHSLGIDNNGKGWAWGFNGNRPTRHCPRTTQTNEKSPPPSAPPPANRRPGSSSRRETVITPWASRRLQMLPRGPGKGWAWGFNGVGQLGIAPGDTDQREVPTAISTASGQPQTWKQLSAGERVTPWASRLMLPTTARVGPGGSTGSANWHCNRFRHRPTRSPHRHQHRLRPPADLEAALGRRRSLPGHLGLILTPTARVGPGGATETVASALGLVTQTNEPSPPPSTPIPANR
jgi:hypothetical protein